MFWYIIKAENYTFSMHYQFVLINIMCKWEAIGSGHKNWNSILIRFLHALLLLVCVVLKQWFTSISKNYILRILWRAYWYSTLTKVTWCRESCIRVKNKCIILCIGQSIGYGNKQREPPHVWV